jgi:hypothetical protein
MSDERNITLCTVCLESLNPYLDIMIVSAIKRLKYVKEIIITYIDSLKYHYEIQEQDGIKIIKLGYDLLGIHAPLINFYISKEIASMPRVLHADDVEKFINISVDKIITFFGHALGLHQCIECATQEYILFCDPDVIFLNNVDEIYLDLMQKYSLHYIGCAHESATVACGHFPYIANSMVKKNDLPDNDFLNKELYYHGELRYFPGMETMAECKIPAHGKWLIRGILLDHYKKFVGGVDFDTGSNLYIWALEKKWRWLSFLTPDCHYYRTSCYRSNFTIKDKFKIRKLIYHQFGRYRNFEAFQKVYQDEEEN